MTDEQANRVVELSAEKRALLAKRLRSTGNTAQLLYGEPIAVIGIGCRFPGSANDPDTYWRILRDGIDTISEVPADRWNVDAYYDPNPARPGKMTSRWGGFIDHYDRFDREFFGIPHREASTMDPQQRLVLEVVSEALERAGQPLEHLAGSRTGVFVGAIGSEFELLQNDIDTIDIYTGTGSAANMIAGRVSFLLDLHGPSLAVDSACSSSLLALSTACQSLRADECRVAIVAGVQTILAPRVSINMSKMQIVTPDGRCKTFDARANGFVRGEGCGAVVLKRLSDALADHDPILATIRGTAVNQDGRSSSLTAPNMLAQQAVVRQALDNGGVRPEQISFVETHGTGTSLGDPIEVEALAATVGKGAATSPCWLGAVKTNIGHLEASAGIAGFIKTVLALQHETIPPNLHFETLNPHITLDHTRLRIPTEPIAWPKNGTRRFAGVSSFGWSGTNTHVVLEEAPEPLSVPAPPMSDPFVIPLSARSPEALAAQVQQWGNWLEHNPTPLYDIAWTASTRRSHFEYRAALIGSTHADLIAQAQSWQDIQTRPPANGALPKVVFECPGQGSQWTGMARHLLAHQPIFRDAIDRCAHAFAPYVAWNLHDVLSGDALDAIDIVQPALFAMSVGLAALWQHVGITPAAVVGHSMGEVAAAHIAGALALDDAARIICQRSRLLRRISGQGAMLAVDLPLADAERAIAAHAQQVSIAVVNGPRATVLAGDPEALRTIAAQMEQQQVFSRWLHVDVAAHSPQIDALAPELARLLADLDPQPTQIPLYSTVERRVVDGRELDADYWMRNLRQPVFFGQAIADLAADGPITVVELSPHPVLLHAIAESLPAYAANSILVSSMRRDHTDDAVLLASLGTLYAHGYNITWDVLYPTPSTVVALPTYPWQHQSFPVTIPATPRQGILNHGRPESATDHPLLGRAFAPAEDADTTFWETTFGPERQQFLRDHQVRGRIVLPGVVMLDMARAAARQTFGSDTVALRAVALRAMMEFAEHDERLVQLRLTRSGTHSARFELRSREANSADALWTLHADGDVAERMAQDAHETTLVLADVRARCVQHVDVEAAYADMAAQGLGYGPRFRGIVELWRGTDEAIARIVAPPMLEAWLDGTSIHPALIDACLQTLAAATDDPDGLYLPVAFAKVVYAAHDAERAGPLWVHTRTMARGTDAANRYGDLAITDEHGRTHVTIQGLRLQRIAGSPSDLERRWLYATQWHLAPRADRVGQPSSWLILGDATDWSTALVDHLTASGETATLHPIARPKQPTMPGHLDMRDPTALRQVLGGGCATPAYSNVVYFADAPCDQASTTDQPSLHPTLDLLQLTQALARGGWRTMPRLWIVTRGTQAATGSADVQHLAGSPLWGFGRTVTYEHPDLRCSLIDLAASAYDDDASDLAAELAARSDEEYVALRAGRRYVVRLDHAMVETARPDTARTPAGQRSFRLELTEAGILDNLTMRAMQRRAPGPGEIEVKVVAAGLNFRDVLIALGLYPDHDMDNVTLGNECAGIVVAVGPDITAFALGDAVIACGFDTFGTHVTVPRDRVVLKPEQLTFEEAAGTPIVFATVYHSFKHLARLEPNERVLVHSAAGGVGLAALQIARHMGADVYATAGTDEKRALLRSLGVTHVYDSRSTDFAAAILADTNGEGVDVVLNSLTGDRMTQSIALLRPYGRFVDLGRKAVYERSHFDTIPFRNNLSYTTFNLLDYMVARPQPFRTILAEIMQQFEHGVFQALPTQVWSATDAVGAFHRLAQGTHIGKCVVSFADTAAVPIAPATRATPTIKANASYVISGGLGGLGLTVAEWLARNGAGALLLLGRRAPNADAQRRLAQIASQGTAVRVAQVDVAKHDALAATLDEHEQTSLPIRGVFHAAAILDDGVVLHQTASRFEHVFAPKGVGGWNLHELTQERPLDLFVLFSSAASMLGSPGQTNYAAANSFLDSLAHYRQARGLPAQSINWGPWAEIGLAAAQDNRGARLAYRGLDSLDPALGIHALERLSAATNAQVGVFAFNLRQWQQYYPRSTNSPFFSHLASDHATPQVSAHGRTLRVSVREADPSKGRSLVEEHLRGEVAQVLRFDTNRVMSDVPFTVLGFDSLMAIEFRNRLEAQCETTLPATLIWSYPTIDALTTHLLAVFGVAVDAVPAVDAKPGVADATLSKQDISDEEAEGLLSMLIDAMGSEER